jgi:TolB protein
MRIRVGLASAALAALLAGCTGSAGPVEQIGPTSTLPASSAPASAGAVVPSTPPDAGAGPILVTGTDGSISLLTPGGGTSMVAERSTTSFPIQPTPSPDGTRVAHTALDDEDAPVTRIWGESASAEIDFGFIPFFYTWSPDGALLAALGNDGVGGVAGAVADVTSGDVIGIGSGAPHFIAWSPDGSRLATHRNGTRVDLVGSDGTVTNVPLAPATFQAPDWLSSDEMLVAVSDSGLQASLVDIPAGAPRLQAVSDDGGTRDLIEVGSASQFDVDPRGLRLAVFDGTPGSGRMRILELDSGAISEVNAPRAVAFEWSPDGSRLLTLSLDEEGLVPEVWSASGAAEASYDAFTPTTTFVTEYLAFWGQYVRTVRLWSPAGDAFVYPAATPSLESIFLQRLDAQEPERLVTGSMAQWLP